MGVQKYHDGFRGFPLDFDVDFREVSVGFIDSRRIWDDFGKFLKDFNVISRNLRSASWGFSGFQSVYRYTTRGCPLIT